MANEQRKIKVSPWRIVAIAKKVLRILGFPPTTILNISFVSKEKIRRLNKSYFGKNRTTDVIALGYDYRQKEGLVNDYLGDIIICPEVTLENSKIYNTVFIKELTLYIVHGILHLLGYDDRCKEKRLKIYKKQIEILKRL